MSATNIFKTGVATLSIFTLAATSSFSQEPLVGRIQRSPICRSITEKEKAEFNRKADSTIYNAFSNIRAISRSNVAGTKPAATNEPAVAVTTATNTTTTNNVTPNKAPVAAKSAQEIAQAELIVIENEISKAATKGQLESLKSRLDALSPVLKNDQYYVEDVALVNSRLAKLASKPVEAKAEPKTAENTLPIVAEKETEPKKGTAAVTEAVDNLAGALKPAQAPKPAAMSAQDKLVEIEKEIEKATTRGQLEGLKSRLDSLSGALANDQYYVEDVALVNSKLAKLAPAKAKETVPAPVAETETEPKKGTAAVTEAVEKLAEAVTPEPKPVAKDPLALEIEANLDTINNALGRGSALTDAELREVGSRAVELKGDRYKKILSKNAVLAQRVKNACAEVTARIDERINHEKLPATLKEVDGQIGDLVAKINALPEITFDKDAKVPNEVVLSYAVEAKRIHDANPEIFNTSKGGPNSQEQALREDMESIRSTLSEILKARKIDFNMKW